MDLTFKKVIKNLLKKYQTRPLKRFGQNFLVDKSAIRKIISAANIQPSDVVLEIGPGIGALTQQLAKKVKKVITVEKDPKMVEILKETLKAFKNVEVIQGDIRFLEIRSPDIIFRRSDLPKYKVVANLPFYLVAPIIRHFLELVEVRPQQMVLVVQKEVAQRICAKPPKMKLLSISVQFYAEPEIISYISKKSFWPRPEVDGAILKISNLKSQISKVDRNLFFKIVKAGFSQPRKQISNNFVNGLKLNKETVKNWLLKNGIQPSQRAQTLSIEDWVRLTKNFKI